MDGRKIGYWATTVTIAAGMGVGGVLDILAPAQLLEQFLALGYPAYAMPMIGVWKLLGSLAVLAPRFPRLKEWAYAGFAFDLVGASVSHASVGDSADKVIVPLVLLAISLASWALRPDSRRLPSAAPAEPAPGVSPREAAPTV